MTTTKLQVLAQLLILSTLLPAQAADLKNRTERAEKTERLPRVYLLDALSLWETKLRATKGDADLAPAVERLIQEADAAMGAGPFTVTIKTKLPPSGDKRDYMSMGPYWWPDPAKPDGLPYMRRDGRVNPERNALPDHTQLDEMIDAVETLALAYYLTEREPYAERAALLLRVFFLDEQTRMNPHLEYAQAIPGRTEGRGIGIVDTNDLVRLPDAFGMIENSPVWNAEIREGLRAWFGQFLDWLVESKKGRDEARTKNNHATQYDAQVAAYAFFVDRPDLARKVMEAAKSRRIAKQIEPDGSQPEELARTKSWSYSVGNLRNFFNMAALAQRAGVDLWKYQTPDGRGLRRALGWHAVFALGKKKWGHRQISGFHPESMAPILLRAAIAYGDPEYERWAEQLAPRSATDRFNLLYPKPTF